MGLPCERPTAQARCGSSRSRCPRRRRGRPARLSHWTSSCWTAPRCTPTSTSDLRHRHRRRLAGRRPRDVQCRHGGGQLRHGLLGDVGRALLRFVGPWTIPTGALQRPADGRHRYDSVSADVADILSESDAEARRRSGHPPVVHPLPGHPPAALRSAIPSVTTPRPRLRAATSSLTTLSEATVVPVPRPGRWHRAQAGSRRLSAASTPLVLPERVLCEQLGLRGLVAYGADGARAVAATE